MLAYPLALVYLFDWLGYQEVTLPIKRENPGYYMQFTDQRVYLALALGLLGVALLISLAVERSRFGMSLLAIKQNELAAEAAGVDTQRWKLLALMVSGGLAAGGGRALRGDSAGGDAAAERVRAGGLGAGDDPAAVWRGGDAVGACDSGRRCWCR